MTTLQPKLTITNQITHDLTQIERARGFLDAATLSGEWIQRMSQRALLLEAHHTTHTEGTRLTLEELCPDVSRRTLQRDLHALEEHGLVIKTSDTNQLNYRLVQEL